MSSAYITILLFETACELAILDRNRKSMGSKIDPWGTLDTTGRGVKARLTRPIKHHQLSSI